MKLLQEKVRQNNVYIGKMYTTDLTFQRLSQTLLACGRIRVMLSTSVECASRTGRRGEYCLKIGEVKGWITEIMTTGSETRKAEKRNSSWKPERKRLIGVPRRRSDEMFQRIINNQDGRT
jgi:hypothetical protein